MQSRLSALQLSRISVCYEYILRAHRAEIGGIVNVVKDIAQGKNYEVDRWLIEVVH